MRDKLVIIGASGHGKVVADIAIKMNQWLNIVFLDDNELIKTCMGLAVIGKIADAIKYIDEAEFFVAIGNNTIRETIQEKMIIDGCSIVKLVHPNAVIGTDVEIGSGTVVMAGVVINSSSKVGKGCILNTCCSLDHDNLIEDYVHISPGAHLAGKVTVGERTWIGIGAIVSNNLKITKDCILGAGTVVLNNIIESATYVGVPSRAL